MRKFALIVLISIPVIGVLGTWRGTLLWYTRVGGVNIQSSGKNVRGYLHRSTRAKTLFLTTYTTTGMRQSYVVGPLEGQTRNSVGECKDWVAPNVPLFPVSIYTPPCWDIVPEGQERRLQNPQLELSPVSFSFTSTSGERIIVQFAGDLP